MDWTFEYHDGSYVLQRERLGVVCTWDFGLDSRSICIELPLEMICAGLNGLNTLAGYAKKMGGD